MPLSRLVGLTFWVRHYRLGPGYNAAEQATVNPEQQTTLERSHAILFLWIMQLKNTAHEERE